MRAYEPLPSAAENFLEEAIRGGALSVRDLSRQLLEKFSIFRGKSWISQYIRTTLRRRLAEDARVERRLRLLKREFGDSPQVLATAVAAVMHDNATPAKPAARRRRRSAGRR